MNSSESEAPKGTELSLDEEDIAALTIVARGLGLESSDYKVIVTNEHGAKEFKLTPPEDNLPHAS